jgi:hypothetical protein
VLEKVPALTINRNGIQNITHGLISWANIDSLSLPKSASEAGDKLKIEINDLVKREGQVLSIPLKRLDQSPKVIFGNAQNLHARLHAALEISNEWDDEIILYHARGMVYILMILVLAGIVMGYISFRENSYWAAGFMFFLAVTTILDVFRLSKTFSRRTPHLIINRKGIWEMTYGFIPWEDIQFISFSNLPDTSNSLMITLTDPEKYKDKISKFNYYMNMFNNFSGEYVVVQLSYADRPRYIYQVAKMLHKKVKDEIEAPKLARLRSDDPNEQLKALEMLTAEQDAIDERMERRLSRSTRISLIGFFVCLIAIAVSGAHFFTKGFSEEYFAVIIIAIALAFLFVRGLFTYGYANYRIRNIPSTASIHVNKPDSAEK